MRFSNPTGSCTEYTYLFIALCRANGLPARYVGGTVQRGPGTSVDTSFHRWAEVYLPPYGWVPVDVQADDGSSGVSHAYFGVDTDNRFATTVGGGDSEYLKWNYHDYYRYYYSGSPPSVTRERSFTWESLIPDALFDQDWLNYLWPAWTDTVTEVVEAIPTDRESTP